MQGGEAEIGTVPDRITRVEFRILHLHGFSYFAPRNITRMAQVARPLNLRWLLSHNRTARFRFRKATIQGVIFSACSI
jgi:hypothetical protein